MAGWLNWKESPGKKKWCCAAEFALASPGRPAVARHSSYLQVSALRSDLLADVLADILANVMAYLLRSADIKLSSLCKEEQDVPRGKHMAGVGEKEQRQYEHIKESAEKSGRYGNRAKEVAARTVKKEHKTKGHAKGK